MSIEDIYELNSLLQGDDVEREDLERHILSLDSAIDQQERRLQYEEEQRLHFQAVEMDQIQNCQKLSDNVKNLHETIASFYNDENIAGSLSSLLLRIAEYETSKDRLIKDTKSIVDDLNKAENSLQNNLELRKRLSEKEESNLIIQKDDLANMKSMLSLEISCLANESTHEEQKVNETRERINELKEKVNSLVIDHHNLQGDKSVLLSKHQSKVEQCNYALQSRNNQVHNATVAYKNAEDRSAVLGLKLCESEESISKLMSALQELRDFNRIEDSRSEQLSQELADKIKLLGESHLYIQKTQQDVGTLIKNIDDVSLLKSHEEYKLQLYSSRQNELSNDINQLQRELDTEVDQLSFIRSKIESLKQKIAGDDHETREILEKITQSSALKEKLLIKLKSIQSSKRGVQESFDSATKDLHCLRGMTRNFSTVSRELASSIQNVEQRIREAEKAVSEEESSQGLQRKLLETREKLVDELQKKNILLLEEQEVINKLQYEREVLERELIAHKEKIVRERDENIKQTALKRTQAARRELNQMHMIRIKALQDSLIAKDAEFKDSFKRAERQLNESEIQLIKELQIVQDELEKEAKVIDTLAVTEEYIEPSSSKRIQVFEDENLNASNKRSQESTKRKRKFATTLFPVELEIPKQHIRHVDQENVLNIVPSVEIKSINRNTSTAIMKKHSGLAEQKTTQRHP